MESKLRVMLTAEGTYPFHQGGVSTWCDILIKKLPEVEFIVYSVMMNPFVTQKFSLASDSSMIKMPLWGTEEPSEHLDKPFSEVFISKSLTFDKVVKDNFLPLFEILIDEVFSINKDPERLGNTLFQLHKYFEQYEYKKSFKSELTWSFFKQLLFERCADPKNKLAEPDIFSMIQSLGWIYRFLNLLNTPIPITDVTHSSAAAFCGIPCVLSKLKYGTPFLLTEHGVYLREQYLSLSKRDYSSYLNTFLIRFIHSISSLNYFYADQVSPVCNYNTRWEKKLGVKEHKIRVIYNGVDNNIFKAAESSKVNKRLTVVSVARIDPIKDIVSLIKASSIVKKSIGDVHFVVYGSISVPEYYEECLKLIDKMRLKDTITLAGHTDDTVAAYRSGDIIALSSISEAFPYSVVEAMMCAKPVIATDVGGIKEALGDTGIVVQPGSHVKLAEEIIKLLKNPTLRSTLGRNAEERALNLFPLSTVLEKYMNSYINLSFNRGIVSFEILRYKKQKLLIDKAYAFCSMGEYHRALELFKQSISENTSSIVVPVILSEIAHIYKILGDADSAQNELDKAEMISSIQNAI